MLPTTGVSRVQSRGPNNGKLDTPTLMFITPDNIHESPDEAMRLCEAVLQTPSTMIQIRDTLASVEALSQLVQSLLHAGLPPEKVIVNNGDPLAVSCIDARLGIHIKQHAVGRDLAKAHSLDGRAVIGCAVHSALTAQRVLSVPVVGRRDDNHCICDYLQVGTMFETKTHATQLPQGPAILHDIRKVVRNTGVALIAVGGINDANAADVIANGADGVAVIRYISEASDPALATKKLMSVLQHAVAIRGMQ